MASVNVDVVMHRLANIESSLTRALTMVQKEIQHRRDSSIADYQETWVTKLRALVDQASDLEDCLRRDL